jgi:hypothetical protein
MCGAKQSEGDIAPADCVRTCIQKGADYALVVGDKADTVHTSDQAALDEFNKLAWGQAKVTVPASGNHFSAVGDSRPAPHRLNESLRRFRCALSFLNVGWALLRRRRVADVIPGHTFGHV